MKRITGNTFVMEGNTNVGVYVGEEIYLVDTGTSRKILKEILEEFPGRKIVVLNTHHHADHISLNRYVQRKTGCEIFAPSGEVSLIENPILEPYILFGSSPPLSLRKSLFVAQPSKVKPLKETDIPLKVVELPGHTPFHVGYLTPDGVLFSGDLYFSSEIVEKYFFPYHSDITTLKKTVEDFKSLEFEVVVPSHGEPSKDPSEDLSFMMERIEALESEVLKLIDGKTQDEVSMELSSRFDLRISGGFYYLLRSFVGAVLVDLESENLVVEENGIWRRV